MKQSLIRYLRQSIPWIVVACLVYIAMHFNFIFASDFTWYLIMAATIIWPLYKGKKIVVSGFIMGYVIAWLAFLLFVVIWKLILFLLAIIIVITVISFFPHK